MPIAYAPGRAPASPLGQGRYIDTSGIAQQQMAGNAAGRQQLLNQRFQTQAQNPHELQLARIGQTGARNQQERFETVFPWLQQQFGNAMGQFSSQVGGQSGAGPTINASPIYNPQQIQQQVNASRAHTDAAAQTQARLAQRSAAGRGLGANSALVQALQGNIAQNALTQNTAADRDIRMRASEANAPHMLQAQQAREVQFANRQQEDIARRQQIMAMWPGILGAIAGLV